MKKLLKRFKEDLKKNWDFLFIETGALLFFQFFVFKLEPIKAVVITMGIVLISLIGVVIFGLKDVLKN